MPLLHQCGLAASSVSLERIRSLWLKAIGAQMSELAARVEAARCVSDRGSHQAITPALERLVGGMRWVSHNLDFVDIEMQALEERDSQVVAFLQSAIGAPLRVSPRWPRLAALMNLPEAAGTLAT